MHKLHDSPKVSTKILCTSTGENLQRFPIDVLGLLTLGLFHPSRRITGKADLSER